MNEGNNSNENFYIKRQILKTPHPRTFSTIILESPDEENKETVKRSDKNNTTKDDSFFSKLGLTHCQTESRPTRVKKFFYNKERVSFPIYDKVSDNFINFEKLREMKSRKSTEEMNKKENSERKSNYDEEIIDSTGYSKTSYNIPSGNDSATFDVVRTPSFGISTQKFEEILNKEPLHFKLPLAKKNNEKFKHVLVNELRNNKIPTDTHKFQINRKRKISELNKEIQFDFSLMKIRKCNSAKKLYQSTLPFIDENNNATFFDVYRDEDIGITEEWKAPLIPQQLDNDYDTDEETQMNGILESHYCIRMGIQDWAEKGDDCLRNKMTFKKS